jgi:hypothetical protein
VPIRRSTGTQPIRSLVGSHRATLGTRHVAASLKASMRKPTITRGEPTRFLIRIAPTGVGRKSGWESPRDRHFRKRLAMRKTRRSALGHWRRARKRVRPR